ncbi:MAG: nucleotidyl transferase AbiEii/AbiGii toxin family protein [Anaerolineales bacterium]|nr:nucleotidyl transferase AbiEii/AbiGii toxin family protein [Anaerolineales bacterium]
MYPSILTEEQKQLLPFVKACGQRFYLVGGTAVALQIGHRKSIDFDLFSSQPLNKQWINKVIKEHNLNFIARFQDGDQLTGMVNSVQITFYEYLYDIEAAVQFEDVIFMPDLLTLAAMVALALGMRAKLITDH